MIEVHPPEFKIVPSMLTANQGKSSANILIRYSKVNAVYNKLLLKLRRQMKGSWTIGKKLIVSFMCVAMITLVLGIVGYYGAVKSEGSIEEIGNVRLPSVDSLLVIKGNAENIRGTMRTLAIPGLDKEMRERQYNNLATARERYGEAWKAYEALPQSAEEARLWNQFVPAWNVWRAENTKAVEMSREFDRIGIANPEQLEASVGRFCQGSLQPGSKCVALVVCIGYTHLKEVTTI
jgi:hypothetical protein